MVIEPYNLQGYTDNTSDNTSSLGFSGNPVHIAHIYEVAYKKANERFGDAPELCAREAWDSLPDDDVTTLISVPNIELYGTYEPKTLTRLVKAAPVALKRPKLKTTQQLSTVSELEYLLDMNRVA